MSDQHYVPTTLARERTPVATEQETSADHRRSENFGAKKKIFSLLGLEHQTIQTIHTNDQYLRKYRTQSLKQTNASSQRCYKLNIILTVRHLQLEANKIWFVVKY